MDNKIRERQNLEMASTLKRLICINGVLFICFLTFATTGSIEGLEDKVNLITSLVNSGWLQGIAGLALAIEAGGLIMGMRNGESGIIKKFLPWMAGTVILLSASSIAKWMWTN